jgi:hypothetical protein
MTLINGLEFDTARHKSITRENDKQNRYLSVIAATINTEGNAVLLDVESKVKTHLNPSNDTYTFDRTAHPSQYNHIIGYKKHTKWVTVPKTRFGDE